MSEELKPCPFCGGKAERCGTQEATGMHNCHFIVCIGGCGAQFDMTCDVENDLELRELQAISVDRFNRRIADQSIVAITNGTVDKCIEEQRKLIEELASANGRDWYGSQECRYLRIGILRLEQLKKDPSTIG